MQVQPYVCVKSREILISRGTTQKDQGAL